MKKPWLLYALTTTIFWGVWGAFTEVPSQNGFPETLIYCVWSLTMIPPALFVLKRIDWDLQTDRRSILNGLIIGLLGAGGQMILFYTVTIGPTYLIFPIISLSPVVTIILSVIFLKERASKRGLLGILLALLALPLFEYSGGAEQSSGHYSSIWFIMAILILIAWGVQAYFMKFANDFMNSESIFFYMMIAGIMVIPAALYMTDFSQEINWGFNGPYLAASIQVLNAIGALCLVYAFRYGKAIVVSPMTNAGAPLMTSIIAILLMGEIPGIYKIIGIIFTLIAAFLLAIEPENNSKDCTK